jgi:hypothetical protein
MSPTQQLTLAIASRRAEKGLSGPRLVFGFGLYSRPETEVEIAAPAKGQPTERSKCTTIPMRQRLFPYALAAISAAIFCCGPRAAHAAGAYVVDDAGIVDPGQVQIESWYNHSSKNENIGNVNVENQVLPHTELTLGNAYDSQSAGDSNTLLGQLKYRWRDGDDDKNVGSSIVLGLDHSTIDNHSYGPFAYIPATWAINDTVALNADLGWRYASDLDRHYVTWGLGTVLQANDVLSFVGEIFDQTMGQPGGQLGVHFNMSNSLSWDAKYGRNITVLPGNWVTAGVTVIF